MKTQKLNEKKKTSVYTQPNSYVELTN